MIGDILKKEREKQKLSLQDVEQGTSIRAVYLEALENGEYDKLPGEVYAKGFIKNYGNFLELNGEELVRKFIIEITPVAAEPETPQPENNISENQIAAPNIGQKYQNQQNIDEEPKNDSKKYLAAAVALVAILLGGIFYAFSGSDSEGVEVAHKSNPPAVTENKTVTPAPQPVAPPPAPVATPVNDVNIKATFSDDCWTRVTVDGDLVFEGMINAGQTFDWKGTQSVNILLGNAGAAQIIMNGQNIGTIGGDGDVVERTFAL